MYVLINPGILFSSSYLFIDILLNKSYSKYKKKIQQLYKNMHTKLQNYK